MDIADNLPFFSLCIRIKIQHQETAVTILHPFEKYSSSAGIFPFIISPTICGTDLKFPTNYIFICYNLFPLKEADQDLSLPREPKVHTNVQL